MKAHKIEHTMQYTEVTYVDDDGNEIDRVRVHDDHTYDSSEPVELTEDEREEWGL